MDEKSETQKSAPADQYFLEIGGVLHPISREYYEEIVKPWEDLRAEISKHHEQQIANYHPQFDFLRPTVEGPNLRKSDKKPCDPTGN